MFLMFSPFFLLFFFAFFPPFFFPLFFSFFPGFLRFRDFSRFLYCKIRKKLGKKWNPKGHRRGQYTANQKENKRTKMRLESEKKRKK